MQIKVMTWNARMNHAVRVVFLYTNKRERKPKEQSRMENPDILATLGTQETE
jgi:hypothetical protein